MDNKKENNRLTIVDVISLVIAISLILIAKFIIFK